MKNEFNRKGKLWYFKPKWDESIGILGADSTIYCNNKWLNVSDMFGFSYKTSRIKDNIGQGQKITTKFKSRKNSDPSVRIDVRTYQNKSFVIYELTLENNTSHDFFLGPVHLLEINNDRGKLSFGDYPEKTKIYVDSGGGWWAGVCDIDSTSPFKEQWDLLPEEDKELILKINKVKKTQNGFHNSAGGIGAFYNPISKTSLITSFLTFNRTVNNITTFYDKKNGIKHWYAGCDFAGYRLKPGKKITTEKLFIGFYHSPHQGLEEYATVARKLITPPPFPKKSKLGWCSWYAYRLKMTEDIVLANARAIKERFSGYDFEYIQADHGWQYKDLTGNWIETNQRFPHGLKWLAGKLKDMGFKMGLWTAPFCISEYASVARTHPEYMIKDADGNPKVMIEKWAWHPHGKCYYLDPTHPGAQKFIRDFLQFLRKQGCRYWKLDFTWPIADSDKNTVFFNKNLIKGAEIYRKGLSNILDVIGKDYVYWCSNPVNLGFGLGPTSMTGSDIGNTGFSLAKKVEGRIEDINFFRQNLTTTISRYFLHRKLILQNPDVVEVGGPGDYEEAKIRLTLVAFSGGQTFLGDDLTKLSEHRWELLSRCIPPYGKAARPIDLFENTYPASYPKIWDLKVQTSWGNWHVIALFNLGDKKEILTVDFNKLGLRKGQKYLVWEFWNKTFLGERKDSVKIKLDSLTTKILLIKDIQSHPVVLSTDMHVTQGGVEMPEVKWDEKDNTLKGVCRRNKGERGNLFVYVPSNFKPIRASVNGTESQWKPQQFSVIKFEISFDNEVTGWSFNFQKTPVSLCPIGKTIGIK